MMNISKKKCSRQDCSEKHWSKGLCKFHYRQDYKTKNREKISAYAKADRIANPEKYREQRKATHLKRIAKDNAQSAAWYAANRDHAKKKNAEHYQKNKERLNAATRERYWNNREQALARQREYELRNKAKKSAREKARRLADPEKDKKRHVEYREKNREKIAERAAKRRAVCAQATPVWSNRFFVREIYDLAQKRSMATGILWTVDHIVPLKHELVSGLHADTNMQVIPGKHNSSKGNYYWPDMP